MQQQLVFETAVPAALRTSTAASIEEQDFGILLTGLARTMFDAMKAIIVSPACRLKNYRIDFFKYDRARLAATHGTGRHIWIVRTNGTFLVSIGVHARNRIELDGALSATGQDGDIYLIDPAHGQVREIDAGQARELAKHLDYVTRDGTVFKENRAIAHLSVSFTSWTCGRSPQGIVRMTRMDAPLTQSDLVALVQIAGNEVIERSHSLFTGMQTCTLDGVDLVELIEQAK
ncbi:hypothetical protein [Burkholderia vietnamiensis]|uniref:hypothetical protein n=1 Tax=Burkholderia vietnamiensis TaxID=60552 RepID=UPI001592CD8F|nr:hypothetical protein [Burkholderia vietnamiensis]